VFPVIPHTSKQLIALLLVCVAIAAAFACQLHPASTHEQAIPSSHHSGSSSPAGPDSFCTVAVLPVMATFLLGAFLVFHTSSDKVTYTAPVAALFIPPRNIAAAS
jgi:hypothetical protein